MCFTSLLGGVPLCISKELYNGTPLGGTTRGTLEGYSGRVLSILFQVQGTFDKTAHLRDIF